MSMSLGCRIRAIRGKESRASFADKFNIGTATLQRYENDERLPELEFLTKLQVSTGYSLDYLVNGKDMILPADENLLLEKFRQADAITKNKILMFLLSGETSATIGGVSQTHGGSGSNINAHTMSQTINNAPVSHTKSTVKVGKQKGDIVNGDKHVTK